MPNKSRCGWCGKTIKPKDACRPLPAYTGNDWPMHVACYIDWFDGDWKLKHRSVVVKDKRNA